MAHLTLVNRTNEMVRLALFMAPVLDPTLGSIAWKIAAPPPGGSATIEIPDDFALQARYSSDPANPSHLDTETAVVAFSEFTASFAIEGEASTDGKAGGAVIRQLFTDLVLNEVRVVNRYPIGVELSILKGGNPIHAPQVLWPGGMLMEDLRGAIHVAVVSQLAMAGGRLVQEEIGMTRIDVLPGDTVVVTGSMWTGYALSRE
ncbi:MAG: hypothetical protein ACTHOH_05925 [Lysobacteraceae bacterium]